MHDIAGTSLIVATVLVTSYNRHRTLRRLRDEVLGGIRSIRSDMRDLRISNLEQNQK